MANVVTPVQSIRAVEADDDDNRILECAFTAASDLIVTHDKDLLRLGRYGNIRIIRADAFFRELEAPAV